MHISSVAAAFVTVAALAVPGTAYRFDRRNIAAQNLLHRLQARDYDDYLDTIYVRGVGYYDESPNLYA